MKEVYELWSFCIHSLHRMVPASADLVDPADPVDLADLADPADPVDLADLADPVVLVDLADLADPVDPADPAVPRPWDPQSPVLRRN